MKIMKYSVFFLGSIPYAYSIVLLGFYMNTASSLGYFPTYNHPDPSTLSYYDIYATIINVFANAWIIVILPWIALSIYLFKKHLKQSSNILVFGAIGYFISIVLFFSDVLEWFAD